MSRHGTRHIIQFSRQNINKQLQCEFELLLWIPNSSFIKMNIPDDYENMFFFQASLFHQLFLLGSCINIKVRALLWYFSSDTTIYNISFYFAFEYLLSNYMHRPQLKIIGLTNVCIILQIPFKPGYYH